jgi:hypothetical protein
MNDKEVYSALYSSHVPAGMISYSLGESALIHTICKYQRSREGDLTSKVEGAPANLEKFKGEEPQYLSDQNSVQTKNCTTPKLRLVVQQIVQLLSINFGLSEKVRN